MEPKCLIASDSQFGVEKFARAIVKGLMSIEAAHMPGNLFNVGHHDQLVRIDGQAHDPVGVRGRHAVPVALETNQAGCRTRAGCAT